jgi:hypothetical protein
MRTRHATLAAVDAAVLHDHHLALARNALRIVTPDATQRAALQKDRRPNARPIMDRVFLNIKYQAGVHD